MPEYILSITSSGGNGHQSATEYIEKLERAKGRKIVRFNILQCYGKLTGNMFTSWWNNAQKAGDIKKLQFLLKIKILAEVLFATPVFLRTAYLLYKYNVVKVIDTQPIGTSSIVAAVAFMNFFKEKNVRIHKVLTDLPTKSEHFYAGIRKITNWQKKILCVHTCQPHLKKGQTEEQFWQKHCQLSLKKGQVKYKPFPLRKDFFSPMPLRQVEVNNVDEEMFLQRVLPQAKFTKGQRKNFLSLRILPKDKVSTVLLASQAAEEAMLNYLREIVKHHSKSSFSNDHYLFLLCGKNEIGKPSLYKKMCNEIEKFSFNGTMPQGLKVIPLSFQSAKTLASLFHTSTHVFVRSSGMVSMELMTAAGSQTKILIHCESLVKKTKRVSFKLLDNMPRWEKGNALYLMKEKKAQLITPYLIKKFMK